MHRNLALRAFIVGLSAFIGGAMAVRTWAAAAGPAILARADLPPLVVLGVAASAAILVLAAGRVPEYSWGAWFGMIGGRLMYAYFVFAGVVALLTWSLLPVDIGREGGALVLLTSAYLPLAALPLTLAVCAVRPRWQSRS